MELLYTGLTEKVAPQYPSLSHPCGFSFEKRQHIEWKASLLIHQALVQGDHDDQQCEEHHYNHYLHDRQVTKEQDDYHIKD